MDVNFIIVAEYIDAKFNKCYCPRCYEEKPAGIEPYSPRGNPRKDYGIPIGWYRFALK